MNVNKISYAYENALSILCRAYAETKKTVKALDNQIYTEAEVLNVSETCPESETYIDQK